MQKLRSLAHIDIHRPPAINVKDPAVVIWSEWSLILQKDSHRYCNVHVHPDSKSKGVALITQITQLRTEIFTLRQLVFA